MRDDDTTSLDDLLAAARTELANPTQSVERLTERRDRLQRQMDVLRGLQASVRHTADRLAELPELGGDDHG